MKIVKLRPRMGKNLLRVTGCVGMEYPALKTALSNPPSGEVGGVQLMLAKIC